MMVIMAAGEIHWWMLKVFKGETGYLHSLKASLQKHLLITVVVLTPLNNFFFHALPLLGRA